MRAGSSDLTEAGLVPPVRYRSHDEDSAHWLDWLVNPRDDVSAHLSAQAHRRFIKTHTPLDGCPAMNGLPTSSWLGIHWTWRFHSTTRGTTSTGSDSGS